MCVCVLGEVGGGTACVSVCLCVYVLKHIGMDWSGELKICPTFQATISFVNIQQFPFKC